MPVLDVRPADAVLGVDPTALVGAVLAFLGCVDKYESEDAMQRATSQKRDAPSRRLRKISSSRSASPLRMTSARSRLTLPCSVR